MAEFEAGSLRALFDANTILYADEDNIPLALTIAEQTLVGRITGGSIAALSGADALLAMGITPLVAELNFVDGVTSAIQTQLDLKAPLASPTFTGTATFGGTISLGANSLLFTDILLKRIDANYLGIYDSDGTSLHRLRVLQVSASSLIGVGGADWYIYAADSTHDTVLFGTNAAEANVEVARCNSAATPTFDILAGRLTGVLDVAGQYLTFLERAAPGAGAANEVRVYAIVGGDTLTDLAAVFQDGTVDIFAQEITPLDSPILTQPSQTEVKIRMVKEHPGLIQFVAEYPNGQRFVLREMQYHDPDKIAANKGATNPLPPDWLVENAQQRLARLKAEAVEKLAKSIMPKVQEV